MRARRSAVSPASSSVALLTCSTVSRDLFVQREITLGYARMLVRSISDLTAPQYGSNDGLVSPALLFPCIRRAPFWLLRESTCSEFAPNLDLGQIVGHHATMPPCSHHQWPVSWVQPTTRTRSFTHIPLQVPQGPPQGCTLGLTWRAREPSRPGRCAPRTRHSSSGTRAAQSPSHACTFQKRP